MRDAIAVALRAGGVPVPHCAPGAPLPLSDMWGRAMCCDCKAAGRDVEACRAARGHREPDFDAVTWQARRMPRRRMPRRMLHSSKPL